MKTILRHLFFRIRTAALTGLLGILFVTILLNARAQESSMTLPEMVNSALEANYNIQIYRNFQKQAENTNTLGNAGMLPRLDLSGEQSFSFQNSEQQFFTGDSQQANSARSESTNAQASLTWVVFDGLAMFARKDRLGQLEALGKTETRYYIEQTAADLAVGYYQLKQEKKLLESYRKTLGVSKARLELQEKRGEIGAGSELDVQRARVDRNTDSSLVLSQQALIRELEIQINQLMNRDLVSSIDPQDDFNLAKSLNLLQIMDRAMNENAQLTQRQIQEMIAEKDVKISRGAMFPEVELFGNYQFGRQSNEVGFLQSSQAFGPNFGVRVRFNLFNGGQQRTVVENAKITAETEQVRVNQMAQQISAAMRVAYLRWENEIAQVELEAQSAKEAKLTLDIAQRQYELGAINDVDFRTIQLNALNAETRYLQAQFRAKSREIELYRLSGQLIEKIM